MEQSGGGEWRTSTPTRASAPAKAGIATHQIVNYYEFGRCADVTHSDIGPRPDDRVSVQAGPATAQDKLAWNHKWYYSDPRITKGTIGPQQI